MAQHYLEKLFNPKTIAVIGASDKPNSIGKKVFQNLIENNFRGQVYAVNPKYKEILEHPCFRNLAAIKKPIDVAVIVTHNTTVPEILTQCGELSIKFAIVISTGFSESGEKGAKLEQKILAIAEKYQIRFIGPNCLGIMRPHLGLNATFNNNNSLPGNIALISQSGALCAGILDWAQEQQLGFSAVISMGNATDIDFGDVLDYLALDDETKSILLYVEGIHDARRFMGGLRAAARMKPVLVIKAGRHAQNTRVALSHTGALIGADDVFDAALQRAGAVRVRSIDQLFTAAEILASDSKLDGNRLGIITNGGAAGVIAADRATDLKVTIAELTSETMKRLNKILPDNWSHQNPIDILGDASPERYQQVLTACIKDSDLDGILVILVPVAMANPLKTAEQVVLLSKHSEKPILTCWMGNQQVKSSWKLFSKHKLSTFNTPETAVQAFAYLAAYHHNQKLLLQVPTPLSYQTTPNVTQAQAIINAALAEKRNVLTTIESKAILAAFAIPVSQTSNATSEEEAIKLAKTIGFPVVMKINSPSIIHKQDMGGVKLNLRTEEDVRKPYKEIMLTTKKANPKAKIIGITVERMFQNPNNRELMIGIIRDVVFGPVISFGAGGSMVEVLKDRAVALPPLNQLIAKQLIRRTRIAKSLEKFRNMPAVNVSVIENILLRVSEMVCELPQIREMDINPLIANDQEVVAVDARIIIDVHKPSNKPYSHMAIHPYPSYLVSHQRLKNGTEITIRPIRPEDALLEQEFVRQLSPKSKYFRFMQNLRELTPSMLVRLTQIDYDREMALIATQQQGPKEINIGVARYVINPDQASCEFAIAIADAWQNKGIGSHLMNYLIAIAKKKGLKTMMGDILANNIEMLKMVKNLGFVIRNSPDDEKLKIAVKTLN